MAFKKETEDEKQALYAAIKDRIQIVEYATRIGLTPIRKGRYWTLKEHDSVIIDNDRNCFWRNSGLGNNISGSVIDFGLAFTNQSMHEVLKELSGIINYNPEFYKANPIKKEVHIENKTSDKLVLPERVSKMNNVFAYLTKTRYLDQDVIQDFVNQKMLYQDEKNNCVFVSYDDDKTSPVFACKRGTNTYKRFVGDVSGSDYNKCFYVNNSPNNTSLIVSESVIDAMSVMSILKGNNVNYKDYNYLALSSAEKYESIIYHLKNNSDINELHLALDNDKAGRNSVMKILKALSENNLSPDVYIELPDKKDWNEQLKSVAKDFKPLSEIQFLKDSISSFDLSQQPMVTLMKGEHFIENQEMTLSKANNVLKELDEKLYAIHQGSHYEKTNFDIKFIYDGKEMHYDGRFDIGDGEGTLINHILNEANSILNDDSLKDILTKEEYEKTAERYEFIKKDLVPYFKSHDILSSIYETSSEDLKIVQQLGKEDYRQDYYNDLISYTYDCRRELNLTGQQLNENMPMLDNYKSKILSNEQLKKNVSFVQQACKKESEKSVCMNKNKQLEMASGYEM